jgi:hypothetical protein
LIQPFPDGKRVFYGPYGDPRVLECTPSLVNCATATTLDIDLSGMAPAGGLIPPGGAVPNPSFYVGGAASPKLSPDGQYIAVSDLRTDSVEAMVLAKLTRSEDRYVTNDARVLNPPGPTSPTDPDPVAWSRSTGLFEFKTFVDGGRAVTYVQVGGEGGDNPDLWKLDLKTGERTRLTAYPEWEEDMATSPDGKSMLVTIDSQGRHYIDWGALMPFRGFMDEPFAAGLAISHVSSAKLRSCAPFASALLPADGDRNGELVGQTVNPYDGGDVRDSGDINGWPSWSPDSTAVALSTQRFSTLAGAPYLLVAHFDRRPTEPLPIVSSAPGSWAPTQTDYHGPIAANTDITLNGLASGTVHLHYANPFGIAAGGDFSATYVNYSDDGESFINGTQTVHRAATIEITDDLTLSGAHTGSLHGTVSFNLAVKGYSGSLTATYDGTSQSGPHAQADLCNNIRAALPRRDSLDATVEPFVGKKVIVTVTSARSAAGLDEQGTDRRPVRGATVQYGGDTATTNRRGVAVVNPKGKPGTADSTIRVSAGDTFRPTTVEAP